MSERPVAAAPKAAAEPPKAEAAAAPKGAGEEAPAPAAEPKAEAEPKAAPEPEAAADPLPNAGAAAAAAAPPNTGEFTTGPPAMVQDLLGVKPVPAVPPVRASHQSHQSTFQLNFITFWGLSWVELGGVSAEVSVTKLHNTGISG